MDRRFVNIGDALLRDIGRVDAKPFDDRASDLGMARTFAPNSRLAISRGAIGFGQGD